MRWRFFVSFLLALVACLVQMLFFPQLRLHFFSPFLAMSYMHSSLLASLWLSALAGLVIDCMNSQLRFGSFAAIYSIVALITLSKKRHFFSEKLFSLSILSLVVSILITLVHSFILFSTSSGFTVSLKFFFTDFLLMPLIDAFYAFLWFTLPFKFYDQVKKRGWKNLLFYKKNS